MRARDRACARTGPGVCARRAGYVRAQGRVCACARAGVATKRVLQQARELVVAIWHVPCACAAKGAHPAPPRFKTSISCSAGYP